MLILVMSKADERALMRGAAYLESQRTEIEWAFRALQESPAMKMQQAMLAEAVRTLADSPAMKRQQAMLAEAVRTLADSPAMKRQQAMLAEVVRTLADSPGVRAQQAMLEQAVQALVNSTGLLRTQQAMVEQAMQVLTRSGLLEKLEEAALEAESGDRAVSDATVTVLAILAALIVLSALTGFRLEEWNRSGQDFESLDRFSLLSDADLIAGWTASAYFLTQQALRALVNRGAARPRD
jgi:hypothetical protein